MNTYDSKRRRLGKVLPSGVHLKEPRDFHLRSRLFPGTSKPMPPAKPRDWPGFKITTVFRQETGSIPRVSVDGGRQFESILPEVLRPEQKRYGASQGKHKVVARSRLRHVSMAIPHGIVNSKTRKRSRLAI